MQRANQRASQSFTQTQEIALLMLAVAAMCLLGVGVLWICWH